MAPISSPLPNRSWLHSPITLLLLVLICAGVLWAKLDAISQNLTHHQHDSNDTANSSAHTHSYSHAEASGATPEIAHQHGPFHAHTHPPDGELSLVPEWAPVKAIALALPDTRTSDPGYVRLLADLTEALVARAGVGVIMLIEQSDVLARAKCDEFIDARKLDRRKIEFYEAKTLDTVWLRDYGPIFVRRRHDGQLFVVDAAYRDVRMMAEEGGAAILGLGTAMRPSDDLAPIYFATLLNKPFVHPGFALNGGDVYADGQGQFYTSDETLNLNTGDREYVAGAFREYLGVRQMNYLRSLPGPTVKHIDMLFKLASPTACLVGKYTAPQGEDADVISLQRAAARALDENATQLERQGLKVHRLPMPDITKLTRWDYFGYALGNDERERRVAAMAKDAELPAEKIRDKLREKFTYAYRTFLNSVLVTPSNGSQKEKPTRRVLIVPRYADASARDLEARVESGYREAYGEELEIVFVEAEALAHGNGSLRCIVCPIPAD